jgi:deoxycytidylate deaminase
MIAKLFSKDPRTQHGSVVVSSNNFPLGFGYNGMPRQYDDEKMDWSRSSKYMHIVHSEINAMNHSDPHLLLGSTLYVTGKPCDKCMLDIVARGVTKVIYFEPDRYDEGSMMQKTDIFKNTDEIAKNGKVKLVPFRGNLDWLNELKIQT